MSDDYDPLAPNEVGLAAPGVKAPVYGKPIVRRPVPRAIPSPGYPGYDPYGYPPGSGYDPNYGYDPYGQGYDPSYGYDPYGQPLAPPPAPPAPEAPPAPGSIAAVIQQITQLKLLESALASPPPQQGPPTYYAPPPPQPAYDPYAPVGALPLPPNAERGTLDNLLPWSFLTGPSADAKQKYVELHADWDSYHAQNVETYPELKTDALEWRQFCDDWDAGGIPSNDIAGRLNAEIIRSNRVRATLLEKQTGKTVNVQDLPGGQRKNIDDEHGSLFLQRVAAPIDEWVKASPFLDHLTNPAGPAIKIPGLPKFPGGILGGLAIVGGALVAGYVGVKVATNVLTNALSPRTR